MLVMLFGENVQAILIMCGMVFAFLATLITTRLMMPFLPADQGREFAVDGAKSKGKPRGAGIVFVLVYVFSALFFLDLSMELILYLALITLAMLTGYLDDAAKVPWGEYKKGFLDLLIAILIAATYLHFNSNRVTLALFSTSFAIPKVVFCILVVVLVWASINVTNCSDGVDGLSATLTIITLGSIAVLNWIVGEKVVSSVGFIFLFIMVLLAYLWFNSTPSLLLMGDAGSRAMGLLIAIAILKTGSPFLYILLAIVLIVDGGIGLVKVALKRFLKISILKNTKTPLHDHVRKNMGWSNTQVVFRFGIIQIMISAITLFLVYIV